MSYHLHDPRVARRHVRGTLRHALLSRPAWRRLAGWLALALTPTLLGVSLPGCSVCRQLQRTLIKEPLEFGWKRDRKRSLQVYRTWADEAWQAICRQVDLPGPLKAEYELGFRDGFVDYVYLGGTGNPPPVPPRHFWNVEARVTDVRIAAEQWCDGYRHGAKTARDGGYRDLAVLPSGCLTGCELEPNAYVQSPLPARPLHRAPDDLRQPESLAPPSPTPAPAEPPALPTPPDGDVVEIDDVELPRRAERRGAPAARTAAPTSVALNDAAPSTMATPWTGPPTWANAPTLDLRGLLPRAVEIAPKAAPETSAPAAAPSAAASTPDLAPRLALATPARSTLSFAEPREAFEAASTDLPHGATLLLEPAAEISEPSEAIEIEEMSDAPHAAQPPLKLLAGAESSSVTVVPAAPNSRAAMPATPSATRPVARASSTTVAAQRAIGGQAPSKTTTEVAEQLEGDTSPTQPSQPVAPPRRALEFLR